jgi:hypothetical protein
MGVIRGVAEIVINVCDLPTMTQFYQRACKPQIRTRREFCGSRTSACGAARSGNGNSMGGPSTTDNLVAL